jgi:hypothetical protein
MFRIEVRPAVIAWVMTGVLAAWPAAGAPSEEPHLGTEPGFLPAGTGVDVGLAFRRWSVEPDEGEDFDLSQFVVPVYVHAMLRDNVDFSYLFNVADSELNLGPSEENQLSGITDGELSLNYYFPDGHFSAGLGLRIPTGESKLVPEEETVARLLAERIFGFRVKHYGEGPDVEGRGAYVTALSPNVTVSAGASYLLKGDFQILSLIDGTENTYEPGDEVSLLGSIRGRAWERDWLGQAQWTAYGTDLRDGVEELEEGTEVRLRLRVRDEHLAGVLEVEADALLKDETKVLSAGGLPPSRDVGGSIFRLGGIFRGQVDRRNELSGRAAVSWYGETDRGVGDALIVEVGPGLRHELGAGFGFDLGYTLFVGSAENGTIDLMGHDVIFALGMGW